MFCPLPLLRKCESPSKLRLVLGHLLLMLGYLLLVLGYLLLLLVLGYLLMLLMFGFAVAVTVGVGVFEAVGVLVSDPLQSTCGLRVLPR